MVLPETIRAALEKAQADGDHGLLLEARASLQASLESGQKGNDRAGLKTIVLCAETALKLLDVETAEWALKTYDLELRRYKSGDALVAVEGKDQYWCRCQFAKALLGKENARIAGLKGAELIKATLDAVEHLLNGLSVVLITPRYTYMCYNASVHYWHVTRELQRPGVRAPLLPSMETVVKAVDGVPGQEEWKVQLRTNLALVYAEAGRPADAQKTAEEAYAMAKDKVPQLSSKMLSLKMHLGEGKAPVPTDAPTSQRARALIQTVRSAAPGAMAEAQKLSVLNEAWALVDPGGKDGGSVIGVDLGVVADIGWVASLHDVAEVAEPCTARALRSQTLRPRVRAELTRHHRTVAALGPPPQPPHSLPKAYTDTCVVTVRKTAELLSSVLRLDDPELVQDTCMVIWNTGLVLLQLHLRPHVQQPFNQAAAALERIASPLHRLRVLFHLELAHCYIAEDVLVTAQTQVSKALHLDYQSTPEERARTGHPRPYDYFLQPMHKVLGLKTSIYDPPSAPELQALLLVESAKEARNNKVKADCLNRAFDKLSPLAEVERDAERPETTHAAKARAVLWGDIVTIAADARLHALVHQCARYVLQPTWDPVNDKLMVLLQAEVSLKEAEACMALVEAAGEELIPLEPEPTPAAGGGEEDDLDEAMPEEPDEVDGWLERACTGIWDCQKLAASINENWLIMNAGVSAWNHYLPLVREARYAELQPLLDPVFDALRALPECDPALLCSMANALACAWEHKFYLSHAEEGVYSYATLVGTLPYDKSKGAAELKRAVEVCEAVIPRASEQFKRRLCATLARCSALFNGPPTIADVDPRAARKARAEAAAAGESPPVAAAAAAGKGKVGKGDVGETTARQPIAEAIAHIEILVQPQGDATLKAKAVNAAVEALEAAAAVDVELWAKLARGAFNIGDYANAIYAGKKVVLPLPEGFEQMDADELADACRLDRQTAYWMALGELIHGNGLIALIRPTEHALEVQDTMKRAAMARFVSSATLGVLAGARVDYLDAPARAFWNAAVSFMGSAITRQALLEPLSRLMPLLRKVKSPGGIDPSLMANMYVVLLEALGDSRRWDEGLAAVDIAFRSVPPKEHAKLWGLKVLFLCNSTNQKGPASILERMEAVSAYEPELQAKVWSMLASQHPRRYEQFMAHMNAIDALAEQPWDQTDYMVDFAEWQYRQGEPMEDVEDMLLTAADAILQIANPPDALGEGVLETGSIRSFRSGVSARSKGIGRPGKSPRAGSVGSKARSTAGTAKTAMTGKSGKSSKGGRGGAPEVKPPAFLTVKHMRLGMRIFVMLSDMAQTYSASVEYLLLAHQFSLRLVRSVLGEIAAPGSAIVVPFDPEKERAKEREARKAASKAGSVRSSRMSASASQASASSTGSRRSKSSAARTAEIARKKAAAEAAAPKARVAVHVDVPCTLDRWATLELSDEARAVLTASGEAGLGEMALTIESMGRPELFLKMVFYMEAKLNEAGLALHVLPLFQLGILVAETVLRSEDLATMVRLRLIATCEQLRLTEAARAHAARLPDGVLVLSDAEVQLVRSQRAQVQRVKDELEARDPTVESRALPLLLPLAPHEVWIEKARYLLHMERPGEARVFLEEAQDHATTMDDFAATAECMLLLSQVDVASHTFEAAVERLLAAQKLMHDYMLYQDNLFALLDAKLGLPGGAAGARADLERAIAFLERKVETELVGGQLEARFMLSRTTVRHSQLLLEEAASELASGRPREAVQKTYGAALASAQTAEACIALEGGAVLVEALLHLGATLMAQPFLPNDPRDHFRGVANVLIKAQAEATRTLKLARPVGLRCTVGLPMAVLLARVAQALAQVQLALAAADRALAAADLEAARPAFPLVEAEYEPADGAEQPEAEADGYMTVDLDALEHAQDEAMATMNTVDMDATAEAGGEHTQPMEEEAEAVATPGGVTFAEEVDSGAEQVAPEEADVASVEEAAAAPEASPMRVKAGPEAVARFLDATAMLPRPKSLPPGAQAMLYAAKAVNLAATHPVECVQLRHLFGSSLSNMALTVASADAWGEPRPIPQPPTPVVEGEGAENNATAAEVTADERNVEAAVAVEGVADTPPLPHGVQAESIWRSAIAAALEEEDFATAAEAALQLAAQLGKSDEAAAAAMILTAQSARVRTRLEGVLCQAAGRTAREHVLLAQRRRLLHHRQEPLDAPAVVANTAYLAAMSPAWSLLQVATPVSEVLPMIPHFTRVISLHLSDARDQLYLAAVRSPTEPAEAEGGGGGKGAAAAPKKGDAEPEETLAVVPPPPSCMVERTAIDAAALTALLQRMEAYCTRMEHLLADTPKAQERPRTSTANGSNRGEEGAGKKKKDFPPPLPPPELDTVAVSSDWQLIVADLEATVAALLGTIATALHPLGSGQPEVPPVQVVLLVDPVLAPLPWEALPVFAEAAAVGRDFSLHTLHRRLTVAAEAASDPKADKGSALGMRVGAFQYLVDLKAEDLPPPPKPASAPPPYQLPFRSSKPMADHLLNDLLVKAPYGKEWSGLRGVAQQTMGEGKVEAVLGGCTALLYYGMGRLLTYVGQNLVARTSMANCRVAVLVDRMQSEEVWRNQAIADSRRGTAEVAAERPYDTAALLSLRGCLAVVLNTLPTLADENALLLEALLQGMSDGGSLGAIVRTAAAALPEADKPKKAKAPRTSQAEADNEEEMDLAPPPKPRLAYQPHNPVVYGLVTMPVAGKR